MWGGSGLASRAQALWRHLVPALWGLLLAWLGERGCALVATFIFRFSPSSHWICWNRFYGTERRLMFGARLLLNFQGCSETVRWVASACIWFLVLHQQHQELFRKLFSSCTPKACKKHIYLIFWLIFFVSWLNAT